MIHFWIPTVGKFVLLESTNRLKLDKWEGVQDDQKIIGEI
jgi:hypothetical protein